MKERKHWFHYFEAKEQDTDIFPFLPMTIGTYPHQNPVIRPTGYEFHQFLWITEGKGKFEINGETFFLEQGQGLFTRKDVAQNYWGDPSFSTAWVTFLSGEAILSHYGIGDSFVFETPSFLSDSSNHLAALCLSADDTAPRAAYGYLWMIELCQELFRKQPDWTETVNRFLEQNYEKPLTLDEIALFGGMDKYSLCKRYLKETGTTVMQTLKQIRIDRAKRFLQYSSFSVEEIGNLCGYENSSYFIKTFRESVGCTPLQYKRNLQ
ncbi:MAG: AraC family transcriptional regulator [Ruminococcaceae bacterium]|nr:AraC family transcriptional regulator [Oscillospiraceae bacterium]